MSTDAPSSVLRFLGLTASSPTCPIRASHAGPGSLRLAPARASMRMAGCPPASRALWTVTRGTFVVTAVHPGPHFPLGLKREKVSVRRSLASQVGARPRARTSGQDPVHAAFTGSTPGSSHRHTTLFRLPLKTEN